MRFLNAVKMRNQLSRINPFREIQLVGDRHIILKFLFFDITNSHYTSTKLRKFDQYDHLNIYFYKYY